MRSAFATVLAATVSASVASAQFPQRLAFDSTRADTASCEGLRLRFLDFRADQTGGNGFVVRVRNLSQATRNFDPSHLRAQLGNGRTVSFLTAVNVAADYLQGSRVAGMDADERFRQQIDIQSDPRFRAGPIVTNSAEERFLALGWSRAVAGNPERLLPVTLFCGRESLGQISFVAAERH